MQKKIYVHILRILIILTVATVILSVAILKYDNEDQSNTIIYEGAISSLIYERYRGTYFLFFTYDGKEIYCGGSEQELQRIIYLYENGSNFKITVTEEKEFIPFYLSDYLHAVEITAEDEVIISIDEHNSDQFVDRVILIAISSVFYLLAFLYSFVIYHYKNNSFAKKQPRN